jgi:hypothetical protein
MVASRSRLAVNTASVPYVPPSVAERYLPARPGTVPVELLSDGVPLMISAVLEARNIGTTLPPVPQPEDDPTPMSHGGVPFGYDLAGTTVRTEYLCTTPCTLHLPPGRTSLHVGGVGRVESIQTLVIDRQPRRVVLYSSSSLALGGGVALALFGGALGVAGAIALAVDINSSSVHALGTLGTLGAVSASAGAFAMAAGIPIIVQSHVGIARSEPIHVVGAFAPIPGGAMVFAGARF